jgi:hypothetical protein
MDLMAGVVADIFNKLSRMDAQRPEGAPTWRERLSRDRGHRRVERVQLDSGDVFYVEQINPDETDEPLVFLPPVEAEG